MYNHLLVTVLKLQIATVLPALRAIRSLFYHLIFSLHRWRSMKVAALFFCTHTHPCNIDMNIKIILWSCGLLLWLYLFEVPVLG